MKPKIIKKTTRFHLPISPQKKLVITLRFLATGETCKTLMYQYRVSEVSVSRFVPEVESFMEKVLWRSICLYQTLKKNGCLWQRKLKRNGSSQIALEQSMRSTHVPLINPFNSGSTYFNYKTFFSIVLFALVDVHYKFLHVNVGCQGRISLGGVFKNSELYHLFVNGEINLPDSRQLPNLSSLNDSYLVESNRESEVPYIIVADDAFPLTTYCMKSILHRNCQIANRFLITDYPQHDVLQKILLEFYQTCFKFYLHACIYNLTMQQR